MCSSADAQQICEVINAGAGAYEGVIPSDCWHTPYMSLAELRSEIEHEVSFIGCEREGALVGVMGSQEVQDVMLIRHAYVRPEWQSKGLGHAMLFHLLSAATRPVLVGTWASATWAIRFYEQHGFSTTSPKETRALLEQYWSVPQRQMEVSTVLVGDGGDRRFFTAPRETYAQRYDPPGGSRERRWSVWGWVRRS